MHSFLPFDNYWDNIDFEMEEPSNLIDPDFGYTSWDKWDETPSPNSYFVISDNSIVALSDEGMLAEQINLPSKHISNPSILSGSNCKRLIIPSDFFQYNSERQSLTDASVKYIKCNCVEYVNSESWAGASSDTSALMGFYIPNGVKYIPSYFFRNSCNLRFIRFPDGLKEIGDSTFWNTGIKNIKYITGDSSFAIGQSCFANMPNLKSVHIKVSNMRDFSFGENPLLENIIIEGDYDENQQWILGTSNYATPNHWVRECPNLTRVKLLMHNLNKFDLNCFGNCPSITTLILPDDLISFCVTDWGNSNTYIYIPKDAKRTDDNRLTSLTSVKSEHVYIHPGNTALWDFFETDNIWKYKMQSLKKGILSYNTNPKFWIRGVLLSDFLIRVPYSSPNEWTAYGLTEIGKAKEALTILNKIYYFDIEDTDSNWKNNICKKLIFNKNFSKFDSGEEDEYGHIYQREGIFFSNAFPYLEEFNVSQVTVKTFDIDGVDFELIDNTDGVLIENYYHSDTKRYEKRLLAYPRNKSSDTYIIPSDIDSICNQAFYYNKNLTSITIPETVTFIGSKCFGGCEKLQSIELLCDIQSWASWTIGDSDTVSNQIRSGAFSYCTSLKTVTFGGKMKTVGEYMFEYCIALTSLNLEAVETIGDYAFAQCESLSNINFPDSLITIGRNAFEYCASLTSVTIPDTITSVEQGAFYWCDNLQYISIACDVPYGVCSGCYNLKTIILREGVTSVDYNAFQNSLELDDVTFPSSLKSENVSNSAFAISALKKYGTRFHVVSGSSMEEYAIAQGLNYDNNI